jgi:hypothetical protein
MNVDAIILIPSSFIIQNFMNQLLKQSIFVSAVVQYINRLREGKKDQFSLLIKVSAQQGFPCCFWSKNI